MLTGIRRATQRLMRAKLAARLLSFWGYEICRLSGPPILRTDVGWPDPAGVWGSILAAPLR